MTAFQVNKSSKTYLFMRVIMDNSIQIDCWPNWKIIPFHNKEITTGFKRQNTNQNNILIYKHKRDLGQLAEYKSNQIFKYKFLR